jgi:prophage regulatory protein
MPPHVDPWGPYVRVISRHRLKPEKGIGYTADHLLRLEKAGRFPKSFQMGPGRVVYDEAEIDEWLEARKRESRVDSHGAEAGRG